MEYLVEVKNSVEVSVGDLLFVLLVLHFGGLLIVDDQLVEGVYDRSVRLLLLSLVFDPHPFGETVVNSNAINSQHFGRN